ncbi:glycosyltransferase [Lewinellaceae bacterium SD302]|nr:glycosyltransferase [Lewinellaceae bacterium SD302]
MKIACLVTNDLNMDRRMDRICRSLLSAGHEVWLIGREKNDSPPLLDRPYHQVRLPMNRQSGKGFYAEYNYKLWHYLRARRWDVINAVDLDTILPAYLAARYCRARLVYDAHEFFSETPEVVNRPLIRKAWQIIGKWLVPKADLCYTVGPELAKILADEYGVNFGVVRNTPEKLENRKTDLSKNEKSDISDYPKKIILYQGMLNAGRGLFPATEALRLLPENYVLWLVGNGDLEEKLKDGNKDLIDQGRLVFHGFVPGDRLAEFTNQAWLGLNLLDAISPSYYYSLANKCFDYIQCGLPSVQMAFPEYEALNKEYHCFVTMDRLESARLSIVIAHLGENPEKYARLRKGCLRAAEVLTWENEEKELLRLWQSI